MPPYKIFVRNHSGKSQAYSLLVDSPDLLDKSVDEKSKTWRVVYQASLMIPDPHGTAVFPIKDPILAVCGTAKEEMIPGAVLYASDWEEVSIGTGSAKGSHCYMSMPKGGDTAFNKTKFQKDSLDKGGAFAVTVDASFRYPHPKFPFIGLGLQDPHHPDNVVPVATYNAEPNATYCIIPPKRYYVVAGTAEPGQIVDMSDFAKSEAIDFLDGSINSVDVIHKSDGTLMLDET